MLLHKQAVTFIGRYLQHSRDRGIIFKIDTSKVLECYVDADFSGGWNQTYPDDASNLIYQTGFFIKYSDRPIYFKYKLQTEVALSTAEAKYIALSTAHREIIPLMTLMEERNEIIPLHINKPDLYCKVWEDNQSFIAMDNS